MEKNEHTILLDIPGGGKNGKYHSALLTTYAIDLIHFDNQILNMLHRKQICSVNVFVDANQMQRSIEYVTPFYMRNIGREYCITSINSVGAFHPKINFFVGDESVLVVFGTGNLTVTGHGKNHEVFTGFMIDETDRTHRPLIEECWRYLIQFVDQCGNFECNRILHEIPDNCIYLDSSYKIIPHSMHEVQKGLFASLLYNEPKSSILQQISKLVPLSEVQKVTVLSPYFDENGESLITLSRICPNATINVLMQKECSLPPCKLPPNDKINFYDFNETKRGKITFKAFDRQLHAKILHFKTNDSEFCIIGSANATIAGLGKLSKRGKNEEFCVLYSSKERDFLTLLGLKTREKLDIPVGELERRVVNPAIGVNCIIRILSAQYESGKLYITCGTDISSDIQVVVDNGIDSFVFEIDKNAYGKYILDVKLRTTQYICFLIDRNNNRVSNKVFVNWIESLETTNPSPMTRNLNRFISSIENNGYNGMEVVDILSDVMWNLVNSVDNISPNIKLSSVNKNKLDSSLPNLKYNPEYDNDDVKSSSVLKIDHTSRLIECIENSIRKRIDLINDAIMDEEEEGIAETSNNREIEEQQDILINKKQIKGYGELSTSLLIKYQRMIDKRYEQVKATGENSITRDDLNFFSLSIFAAIEICYLNRFRYKFDEKANFMKSCHQKMLYDALDRSICVDGLNSLEKFVRFCMTMKLPVLKDENYDKAVFRTVKYAILYGALFYKFSNQETLSLMGIRVLKALKSLLLIFETPSIEFLSKELEPLSKKYDFTFRINHIDSILARLNRV